MKKSDYAVPIKQLLNIDESEQRYRTVRNLVRQKVEYEPRRRKDVDFIFMAGQTAKTAVKIPSRFGHSGVRHLARLLRQFTTGYGQGHERRAV